MLLRLPEQRVMIATHHHAVRGECPAGPEAATDRRFQCQSVPLSKVPRSLAAYPSANQCQGTTGNCAKISVSNQRCMQSRSVLTPDIS